MCRLLGLIMVMVAFGSTSAYAAQRTFYFQASATASAEDAGSVYVSFASSAPGESNYASTMTTDVFSKKAGSVFSTPSNTSTTLYLYANAKDGYRFVGWFDNSEMTGTPLSTSLTYKPSVTSKNYSNASSPAIFEYYAKFVEASVSYNSTVTASCVGEGGIVAVSATSGNEDFGAEKSDSKLNDMETAHTYYLQAKVVDVDAFRFVGWYSDEACQTLLSKNANYTYKVAATSTDEAAPTQFHAYAKFERIPYYYSVVNASAFGQGTVNVSATNTAGDYQTNSSANQKVADKAEHTYYLKAQANVEGEFEGWYTDEACTNKLTDAPSYTYNVTSTSQDEAAKTTFNVYAKFSTRDMYQVRNAGFEKWAADNEPGYGWNSFPSAVGSQAGLGKGLSPNPEKVEGRNGGSAVRIFSKYAGMFGIGANANGNLTTGVVNMGSTTPANLNNYNYTDTKKDGHFLVIAGQPDAVEFYSKYTKGQSGDYTGHAQFIIHDEYNYRDPEVDEEQSHKIGSCGVDILESEDWVRNTGDISYLWEKDAAAATTKYLLINFTTNVTPGGSKDDVLILDDVRLIYNSELASAKFGGEELTFTAGEAVCEDPYDENILELTSNGRAASITTSFDEDTHILTITVKGENISSEPDNYHTYTIQFAEPDPSTLIFRENLYVTVNGSTVGPQKTKVLVNVLNENYDFNFTLKNFALGEGADAMPVGNIKVTGLSLNADGSFAFNDNITIEPGDDAGKDWYGPKLGQIPLVLTGQLMSEDHMLVNIDIDMTSAIGQVINVKLGYDAAKLSINAAAKYGTFCAPFEVKIPAGVTAYTIDGVEGGALNMNEINGTILAHTPVIVYGDFTENKNLYQFGVATEGNPAAGDYLKGTYTAIASVPQDAYLLQNQSGKVGFYKVTEDNLKLAANRCYLTTPEASPVKAFFFDEETAVKTIEALTNGKAEIFDMNGRKLQKLQKGINIVNGKKVLVK